MNRSIVRCSACRYHVLDTFAALAGVTIRSLPQVRTTQASTRQLARPIQRTFSTSRLVLNTQDPNTEHDSQSQTEPTNPATSNQSSIPWYLQVQTPDPPAASTRLHALEEIPPIPPDAPSILHPILSHLSTQIGLDNITLLDLRDVYPPPALGSNLLMVLGTARSYKHLNTSADRFCRWLRSKYKLVPYADGLLGRNELKLKLRRKARRLKLAQSVGNTVAMGSTEGGDDGITTGWICVNIGSVDEVEGMEDDVSEEEDGTMVGRREQEELGKDEEEYKNPPDDSGVIGFGSRDTRQRIVVQMFTEEKRVEMDLEGLWDVRVTRREKKEQKIDKELSV